MERVIMEKKKVLIVDDDSFRESIKDILMIEGYDVFTAEDGHKALAIFIQEMPDLILTDIIMPDSDGLELIMNLKNKYPDADFKVFAMSGGGKIKGEEYLSIAKNLGASEVFTKPLDLNLLISKIKEAI